MGGTRVGAAIGGAACVALAFVFACSDLDGLAATDSAGDAAAESTTPVVDGSPPSDGGASGDADANAPAFCETRDATFCDDFERGLVSGRWTETSARGDGAIGIVNDGGADGSAASLRAAVAGDAAVDGGPAAFFTKRYPGAASKVICHAAVYVENAGAAYGTSTFFIGTSHAAGWFGFGLDVGSAYSTFWIDGNVSDGGKYGDQAVLGLLPSGQWLDVVLETDFTTAKIRVDGAAAVEMPIPPLARDNVEIWVGIDTVGHTAASRIDNVACDVTP